METPVPVEGIQPKFLLRFDDGTPTSVETESDNSSVWQPQVQRKETAKFFNPRFSEEKPIGSILEVPSKADKPLYFVVTKPMSRNPYPNSIYAKRVPEPENLQQLRDEGKVFFPDNLPPELQKKS